jgi:uncharacterized protein YkwD
MHRASGFTSRRIAWSLLPLAVLTILGLVLGRSLLGSASAGAPASAVPEVASSAAATSSPTTAGTTVPVTKGTPVAPGTSSPTTTSSRRIKHAAPKTTPKKSPKPPKSAPTAHHTSDDGETTPPSGTGFAAEMLNLVNVERKRAGCGPLALDRKLNAAAQAHTTDMATHNFLSHDSPDGRTPFDRITAAGYSFGAAAENIAAGSTTASATMKQWMNSPGHKANILNCAYVDLGVGYAKGVNAKYPAYWTQDFGKPL